MASPSTYLPDWVSESVSEWVMLPAIASTKLCVPSGLKIVLFFIVLNRLLLLFLKLNFIAVFAHWWYTTPNFILSKECLFSFSGYNHNSLSSYVLLHWIECPIMELARYMDETLLSCHICIVSITHTYMLCISCTCIILPLYHTQVSVYNMLHLHIPPNHHHPQLRR